MGNHRSSHLTARPQRSGGEVGTLTNTWGEYMECQQLEKAEFQANLKEIRWQKVRVKDFPVKVIKHGSYKYWEHHIYDIQIMYVCMAQMIKEEVKHVLWTQVPFGLGCSGVENICLVKRKFLLLKIKGNKSQVKD